MKHINTTAIILKRMYFGEADRIITLLTPEYGKVSVLAKGIRKSKSKLAGGLELFSVSNIGYIDGKSNLKTVISSQLVRYYGDIVRNVEASTSAYEFLKLTDSFTQESCDSSYFDLLDNALNALNDNHESVKLIHAWFVVQLLLLSGHGINLDSQLGGEIFEEDKTYSFSYEDMAFFSDNRGSFGPKHIKFLRLLEKISKPANLIKVAGAHELTAEVDGILKHCLNQQG